MIDIHSHILYGLDDGAQTMEQSIEMAKIAEKDGIDKIIATPHLFRGNFLFDNFERIEQKRDELSKALEKNKINVEIFTGAEVHITHNLIDEIRRNRECLVLNNGSYILVEFPTDHIFSGVKNLFFDLMSEDITPIIAHPERNSVFRNTPELLYELIHMGGLTQANQGSLFSHYGNSVQETVYQFLEWNFVHFIGSDAHNTHLITPRLSGALDKISEKTGADNAKALVLGNPQAVLDDKELPYLPEPVNPKEKQKSFKIKIPKIFWKS